MFGININRVLLLAGMRLGIPEAMAMIAPPSTPGLKLRSDPHRAGKVKRGFHVNRTTYHASNGERECARRRRQIIEGRLRRENGLEDIRYVD